MTFEQARNDFIIFKVYKRKQNKKGKWVEEEIEPDKWEDIPNETQGKIATCNCNDYGFVPQERLCFIANKGELEFL